MGAKGSKRYLSLPGTTTQSRGPWLASRFCCPAGSKLTMASSETLASSRRFIGLDGGSLPSGLGTGGRRELPQFAPHVCTPVPPSVPRWTDRLQLAVASPVVLAFVTFQLTRHPLSPCKSRFTHGRLTRLQSSLDATARRIACPTPTKAFTTELSPTAVTRRERRL